jgi:phospholipid/cholesterol/gamma-HCH transport system ATP-binding protein
MSQAATPDKPILEFSDVSARFDDTWALRDVSLALRPGETRVIFGEAGSGKTTLLKAAIGLTTISSGEVKLFGENIVNRKETELFALRARAGFVFQEGGLFDSLSVGENVEYPLLNRQIEDRAKQQSDGDTTNTVRDALRFVELEKTYDKFPSEISGGMRRRVGIARAIVTEPPLVLYDSPTAGLDPITANTIMALIAKERDVRNSASLIVTHRYQDGEIMADFYYDAEIEGLVPVVERGTDQKRNRTRFIVMKEGEIVFFGTRQEMEASSDAYVRRFVRHEE